MTDHKLYIKDGINMKENVGGKLDAPPTKEQLENVEKSLVLLLLDLRKTLESARDLLNKLGFTHLGNILDAGVKDADIYLMEYEKGKEREQNAK